MVIKRLKTTGGFTLTELMLVVAILGIVFSMGPQLLTQVTRYYYLHNAKIEIQRDARSALDTMNRYIRQATATGIRIDEVAGQPPYSQISFTTEAGVDMKFYQQGTNLYQVSRAVQSTVLLSSNLRYIAFTYPRSDDPTIISVAMTMEKATYQGGTKALELSIEKVRVMN